jgi:hypothetical protein
MTIGQNAVGASFDEATTAQLFELGTMMWGIGKCYVYVQASGAITGDGYVVTVTSDFQAAMIDTDVAATIAQGEKVGVADCAFADNQYGWAQVYGPCGIRSEQDALANSKLYATADAGQVDDAAASGKFINGMHFGTATGGADAVNTTGRLNWPTVEIQMEPET